MAVGENQLQNFVHTPRHRKMFASKMQKCQQHPKGFPGGPRPSTDRDMCRLTSKVERDLVHSTLYGRQRKQVNASQRNSSPTGTQATVRPAFRPSRHGRSTTPTSGGGTQNKIRYNQAGWGTRLSPERPRFKSWWRNFEREVTKPWPKREACGSTPHRMHACCGAVRFGNWEYVGHAEMRWTEF